MKNAYIPESVEILDILKHTDKEWTFRVENTSKELFPGQFYEISIPKYGESPISVCGFSDEYIDFTIRNVGKVTQELYNNYGIGDKLFIRGPYGNGFDLDNYKGRELIIVSGGSALAPVRGIVEYFYNKGNCKKLNLISGFRSPDDVLFKDDLKRWSKRLNVNVTVDGADEGYKGNIGLVTKYIPELEIEDVDNVSAVIVGPPIMMKFAIAEIEKLGIAEENIWVSYERKMCCGLGKCGHCKIDDTYICIDGPVFRYSEAKHLVD